MYEIYLDESNGSIREEDDDIPAEELNTDNANGDTSKPVDEVKVAPEVKTDTSLTSGSNNVWVSGLSSSTRAASLQTLFKKHGKVLSAKIITNPRMPGSRAHGFITMETAEQAEKCIQHLNKTELDGKTITVSKNRPSESSSSSRHKSTSSSSSTKKDKPKDKDSKSRSDENKESDKDKSKDDSKKSDEKSSHDDDKKKREKSGDKDKEKEKDRQKDRDKEKEKTKNREKDKSKDKEKEKKKDDDKDQSKEKDKDRDKGVEKDKSKEKDKDKTKEKEKDKDKDKDKSKEKDKDKDKKDDKKDDKSKDEKEADKKDESKDEIKIKKERSSKSPSRSRSRDHKKGSESPPRKLGRRPMRRLAPAFLARRMNTRGRSSSSRPNPVLLRRIETERAQRRRERDREIQEAKRRRIELIRTQREVERKAQEERDRIEREMVKLRIERERLEREKAEILRLEREKARLERERLERERDELRRKQFQLPHRIDDSPRGRSGINKRPYDSRGDPRDMDLHWDDRKRMSNPSPVTASGRPFNVAVGSRMSDFDARHGHTSAPYDNKGGNYRRMKLDNPSSGASRNEYDMRRDSGRHGGSGGGHDRDDRRNTGGPSGGYYRDSSRMTGSSRDRDRRGGGGRDDWKGSHDRRDRYLDKGLTSIGSGYSAGAAYSGGNSGDWNSGDRGSSNLSKMSYPAGPSVSESRSRGTGLSSSLMTGGGNQLNDLYDNSSNMPMAGIMSHGGIGSASGLGSDERPYMHSVRRF